MLTYVTAGESHGPGMVAIVEGVPCGIRLGVETINRELARRQLGYGRGGRMEIEKDRAEILSGVRFGKSVGSPIAILVRNRDWENWKETMSVEELEGRRVTPVTAPRPGHADLAGALKTGQRDLRNVLERASARETVARVAAGAVAKALLREFGIEAVSHVISVGAVKAAPAHVPRPEDRDTIDGSPVRCFDPGATDLMVKEIDDAKRDGDTLGGTFEILVYGCPPGLGGYAAWTDRLDGRLGRAVMSIPAIKGVEIGLGFAAAVRGSAVHDVIRYEKRRGFGRETNRGGGIEGGMTNGEIVLVRAAMKPLPTLGRPLATVDLATREPAEALRERSDVCAVPSAAVIGEAVICFELAGALLDKFGSDSLSDAKAAYQAYLERIS